MSHEALTGPVKWMPTVIQNCDFVTLNPDGTEASRVHIDYLELPGQRLSKVEHVSDEEMRAGLEEVFEQYGEVLQRLADEGD